MLDFVMSVDPAADFPGHDLQARLRCLPKTETHLHIEGALPLECLRQLDPEQFANPPASWHPDFRFRDFAEFEQELLRLAFLWFTSPERYHEAAKVLFAELQSVHHVAYVETSFASGMMEYAGLDGAEVAEAIVSAAPEGMQVRVFMGIHHNGYHAGSRDFIEASLHWPHLFGLDLHGTETLPLEPWTPDLWRRARDAGKVTKAHAGEFCGPGFVRQVVNECGVRRLQHGVRAAEDPELLSELRDMGVVFDVCPISNLKLGVVPALSRHPIRQLVDGGLICTLSTDDPLSFGNNITGEFMALHQHCHFSLTELAQLARNGLALADPEHPAIISAMRVWQNWVDAIADHAP